MVPIAAARLPARPSGRLPSPHFGRYGYGLRVAVRSGSGPLRWGTYTVDPAAAGAIALHLQDAIFDAPLTVM